MQLNQNFIMEVVKVKQMENDLKKLKDDINEIKTLLKALSNG